MNEKNMKAERGYTTVTDDDGVNYRDIAEVMTEIGFKMNHSSARNHVIRVMRKFAASMNEMWDLRLSEEKLDDLSKSSMFQHGIADVLHDIEAMRKRTRKG